MMDREKRSYSEYKRRRKRKRKSYGCLLISIFLIIVVMLICYGIYSLFIKKDSTNAPSVPSQQQITGTVDKKIPEPVKDRETKIKYGNLFGNARYLIHIHKQIFKLELYEKDNQNPVRIYDIAVAKNPGDKKRTGDNRTPTSWGNVVGIPASYKGAKIGVSSQTVPFRVEEICDAASWTHDFNDGKGIIKGAYGPWFISLDTGWDGIGIHGTHDPTSIRTNASEGCIRLNNNDVEELKRIIYSDNKGVGTRVIITED